MSSTQSMFSLAGESPPSAPQLSGLKNEVGREIHKPVLKNLFAGKLLIDPLGSSQTLCTLQLHAAEMAGEEGRASLSSLGDAPTEASGGCL